MSNTSIEILEEMAARGFAAVAARRNSILSQNPSYKLLEKLSQRPSVNGFSFELAASDINPDNTIVLFLKDERGLEPSYKPLLSLSAKAEYHTLGIRLLMHCSNPDAVHSRKIKTDLGANRFGDETIQEEKTIVASIKNYMMFNRSKHVRDVAGNLNFAPSSEIK